jgi:polar amino acid transport system substrate-binding protein
MKPTKVTRRTILTTGLLLSVWASGLGASHAIDDASLLAPKGKLRVALIVSNLALVNRDPNGEFSGVAIDLAKALADSLGAVTQLVPYDNPTRYNLSLGKDEWDVAFTPRDLSRTTQLAFSNAFMEADNSYVARASLSLAMAQDVDRAGIKVAVAQGSPLDGFLTRTLKNAEIVRVPAGLTGAAEALSFGRADAYADNTTQAYRIAAEVPGATVLLGRFNTAQMTIAIPKSNVAALPILNDFLAGAKRDGVIGDAIKAAGLRGVRVTH